MRSLIRQVTRKSRGGVAVRDEIAEGDIIIAGRGNDCAIRLPDPRVMLHHAEFTMRSGELYVSAAAGADLRINDNLAQIGKLETGSKVRIGPYEIEVQPPESDFDFVVAVELVQALGDDLEKLVARSQIHITRIGLTMRWWVWLLAGAIITGTFLVPFVFNLLVGPPPDKMALSAGKMNYTPSPTSIWTSGSISSAHKFFADSCETCHAAPFVPVQDNACLSCHSAVQNHAQPALFPFADLNKYACQNCHKEHQGNVTIVRSDEAFCADCHKDLGSMSTRTTLDRASDFGKQHPEFRPTVVKDSALHTMDRSRTLNENPPPQENSGLKFPHDKHLRREGVKDPVRGVVNLDCADCHTPNETGETMRAVSFERNCHGCHALKFDSFVPNRELTHGKPEEVFKQVYDVYDALAMRGGYDEPAAPALVRRRPGTPLTPVEKALVTNWAAAKASDVLNGYFGRGLCAECHNILETKGATATNEFGEPTAAPEATSVAAKAGVPVLPAEKTWTVEPPTLTELWMPKAYFTHARHTDVKCTECHAAKTSTSASDVLLPSIAICQSCHGGEKSADRVPSTCVDCHRFHRRDLDPMHPEKAAAHKAADAGVALPQKHPHVAQSAPLPRWETP
ncbi:MAG: cytochrome c3 family protein [Rhodospirillaceae bacterium]|nr:cytochrome c3 family protein [Rhodospirillaceae bacterium]